MRERKQQNKITGKKKWGKIALAVLLVTVIVSIGGTGMLFQEELQIIASIDKVQEQKGVYYMEVKSDYHFEEFLERGGASSDEEVSAFLTNCISKGFYQVDVEHDELACSVISATDSEGGHLWGRNFDWTASVPIIVKCMPKEGYASISTCEFGNITGNTETAPDDFINKMLAVAAVYVPMDGVNEAGLCVADLEVNEGGMEAIDTDKPDLTITTAIRLLLNRAATVEEAIALLEQYDIHASGGISHHLAISDAEGNSVCIEFVDGEMVVVDTNSVTNFNLANGNPAAGGESAQARYETLCALYEANGGVFTTEGIRDALSQVAQTQGQWHTQWSVVYAHDTKTVDYYFDGTFQEAVSYEVSR
ncbi:MAG: linear amide C-N hydrolase [Lachnospiraceae bacterium]|nr:linear amide C-N hydrolase [Lachnospiraceae bacterium]